jgi:thymidylate synthase (FAD)
MAMDTMATTPQPAPTGNGADITDMVVRDLTDRREAGTLKYGTSLRAFNGRNALIDAYQESLDMTLYLRQKLTENGERSAGASVEIETTDKITVRLIQKSGGDHMVVAAARVSTSGEDAIAYAEPDKAEESAGLINYLMAHRHGTPFEHASLTFFVHAPIFVWREWHRHRIGFSYNEESARYKQLRPVFWLPSPDRKIVPAPDHTSARPQFQRGNDGQFYFLCDQLKDSYRSSYFAYQRLLDAGFAKEVARACLPVGIYSSCWVTCNPRSLMAFLSLRTHEASATFVSYPQAEIETAARAAEQFLQEGWPLTYAAFVKNGRVAP